MKLAFSVWAPEPAHASENPWLDKDSSELVLHLVESKMPLDISYAQIARIYF